VNVNLHFSSVLYSLISDMRESPTHVHPLFNTAALGRREWKTVHSLSLFLGKREPSKCKREISWNEATALAARNNYEALFN